MNELVVSLKGELHGDAKRLDRHHRDGADGRADRDEDERVLLAVHWRDAVDHDGREDRDSETVKKKGRFHGVSQEDIDLFHRLVRGRVEDNDD